MADWWHQNVLEASKELLSLGAPGEFMEQAEQILSRFRKMLRSRNVKFSTRSRARRKAVWLLQTDALGALDDGLRAVKERRLRSSAALFRAAEETMALASYLSGTARENTADLRRWYQDETIDPERVRKWLAKVDGAQAAEASRRNYLSLAHLAHRTYSAVLHGCSPGPKRKLAHTDFSEATPEIPAQMLAEYCAVSAWLISRFGEELIRTRQVKRTAMNATWQLVLGDGARCAIRTRSGRRCRRYAVGKGGRCWQHRFAT